jgi:hypothetical protein
MTSSWKNPPKRVGANHCEKKLGALLAPVMGQKWFFRAAIFPDIMIE